MHGPDRIPGRLCKGEAPPRCRAGRPIRGTIWRMGRAVSRLSGPKGESP